MSKHLDLGNSGEAIAKEYLIRSGYEILETNWRFSRAEIDIIAMDGSVLVFVEVKTRSTTLFGDPALAVTSRKQQLLYDAANVYMSKINHDWEIRFDILSIVLNQDGHQVKHFRDAFFPGW